MIRFVARYELAVDDFAAVDALGERLMDTLVLDSTVLEPDLAVSMTEGSLELHMLVDTEDLLDAVEVGHRALRTAFGAAGHSVPNSKLLVHSDLLQPRVAVQTELLSA